MESIHDSKHHKSQGKKYFQVLFLKPEFYIYYLLMVSNDLLG